MLPSEPRDGDYMAGCMSGRMRSMSSRRGFSAGARADHGRRRLVVVDASRIVAAHACVSHFRGTCGHRRCHGDRFRRCDDAFVSRRCRLMTTTCRACRAMPAQACDMAGSLRIHPLPKGCMRSDVFARWHVEHASRMPDRCEGPVSMCATSLIAIKKRMRNSFVPVAHQQGFRVLYELENAGLCKHSLMSVLFPPKAKNNRTQSSHRYVLRPHGYLVSRLA